MKIIFGPNDRLKKYLAVFKPIFWELLSENKVVCLLSFSLLILASLINVTLPYLFKNVLDSLNTQESIYSIFYAIAFYSIIWILNNFSPIIKEFFISVIKQKFSLHLIHRTLSHIFNLSFYQYIDYSVGKFSNLFVKAKNSIPPIFWTTFFIVIPLVLEIFIVTLILLMTYPIFYAFLLLTSFLLIFSFAFYTTKLALKAREKANIKDMETDSTIHDWIMNYEAVKLFDIKKQIMERADVILKERALSEINVQKIYDFLLFAQASILGLCFTMITAILGYYVYTRELKFSDFILIHGYLTLFINPINALGFVLSDLKKSIIDLKQLLDFFLMTNQEEKITSVKLLSQPLRIDFINASFHYDKKVILNDVSFTLEAGKITGLIGESGIGKSTIMMLILKLRKLCSGEILINGNNISDISQEEIARLFNIIPQNTSIFNDTIYNNVLISNSSSDFKKVKEAVELACLSNSIDSMHDQYKTVAAERGMKLSGGEKQRVSIARFFLKDSLNCLIDEHTNSLDTDVKNIIQSNIHAFITGKTSLIISHDYSILQNANRVLELRNGKISIIK